MTRGASRLYSPSLSASAVSIGSARLTCAPQATRGTPAHDSCDPCLPLIVLPIRLLWVAVRWLPGGNGNRLHGQRRLVNQALCKMQSLRMRDRERTCPEKKGLVEAEWGQTDTGREAKFYQLTESGRAELEAELNTWHRYVRAMGKVLGAPARG